MASRILLIDTNYPINSRNQRIIDSLKRKYGPENIGVIAWNRNKSKIEPISNLYLYDEEAKLGDRLKKLRKIIGFKQFIKNKVKQFSPNIIIASHWDSLFMAYRFQRQGIKIFYENLDMPNGSRFIRYILKSMEKIALKRVTAIIHASRFFPIHYNSFHGSQLVIENLPDINSDRIDNNINRNKRKTLKIVYNGGLRYAYTMINLIKAVGNDPKYELELYGGSIGLQGKLIIEEASKYSNVNYRGSYIYEDIYKIIPQADVLWAVYTSTIFNVKYAISNKFHESMRFAIPAIFAKNTKLGELVEKERIGFVVDDQNIYDIKQKLMYIQKNKEIILNEIKLNIKDYMKDKPKIWNDAIKPMYELIDSL